MPRPTNKDMLLSQGAENFSKLMGLIGAIPEEKRDGSFGFDDRDKNIRDVLVHLHEWHLMMLGWYRQGMRGEKPDIPAKGHTWQTIPALNMEIWEKHQSVSFDEAMKRLAESHHEVTGLIEAHTDEELFTKKKYKWTNTTSLGAYFISSTSSHYDWAIKKIRKYQKELQQK